MGQDEGQVQQPIPNGDASAQQELTARLQEAERECEQFKKLLQRTQADFINYRKRTEAERQEMEGQVNARLLKKLLPVLDEFEMALSHLRQSADQAWAEGTRLVYRKLVAQLESEGVKPIEAMGKPFDPFEHEALAYKETDDQPEGWVVEVINTGYKLNGRVLRAARVVVAKGVASSSNTEEKTDA
jgi:molecular chaperone GrpE